MFSPVADEEDLLVGGVVPLCTGGGEADLSERTSGSVHRTIRVARTMRIASLSEVGMERC